MAHNIHKSGDTKLIRVHAKMTMNEAFHVIHHGRSETATPKLEHHHKTVTFATNGNASSPDQHTVVIKSSDDLNGFVSHEITKKHLICVTIFFLI